MRSLAARLGIDPWFLGILAEAGYRWLDRGGAEQARDVFEGLVALVPESPTGHLGLAEVHLINGDGEAACVAACRARSVLQVDGASMAMSLWLEARARPLGDPKVPHLLHEAMELDRDGPVGELIRSVVERATSRPHPADNGPLTNGGTS